MSEEEKPEGLTTSCEKCIFAKWYQPTQTQIGCQFNRIEKFKKQGSEVKMVETDGKSHYIIKDRICLPCCSKDKALKLGIKNSQDMRKLIELKCEAYIVVTNENNLPEVKATIDSLNLQNLRPTVINTIINTDKIGRASLVGYFKILEKAFEKRGLSYLWNVIYISDVGPNGERNSTEWALDHAVANCKSPFYCVFMAGQIAPREYLSNIDYALNEELERFCLLLPADGDWQGAFVQTILHKKLHGNLPEMLEQYDDGELVASCLFDKIEYIADKTEQPYMIKKVTEICPTMKLKSEPLSLIITTENGLREQSTVS